MSQPSSINIDQRSLTFAIADGKRKRPYDTVLPLANDLGLTVDVSCDRDDSECVADAVHDYEGEGNILIRYVIAANATETLLTMMQ